MPRKKVENSGRKPPPEEMLDFPKRLEKARVARGMQKKDMADASGVDAGTVGRWINGEGWETAAGARFAKLAIALDVSLDWLLLGDEPMDRGARDASLAVLFEDSERGDRVALYLERRLAKARQRLQLSPDEDVASDKG